MPCWRRLHQASHLEVSGCRRCLQLELVGLHLFCPEAMQDFAGSAIIVSHDRWFLDRVCTHTLAFEEDRVEFYDGPVSAYYEWRSRYRK